MYEQPTGKKRIAKGNRRQTLAARRQADRQRRSRKRQRQREREKLRRQRQYKFRCKVVRTYRRLRQHMPEKKALQLTLERFAPREPWHQRLSASTLRRWDRIARQKGFAALRPQSTRPKTIHYHIPDSVVFIVMTMRMLLGWGGHRICAEVRRRGIGSISGTTVYKLFARYGLPVKTYALKGKSLGIAYRRYEKRRPNQQWHIDLKQVYLADGTKVYICILIDDHSRYCLAVSVGTAKTTEWVTRVTCRAIQQYGRPESLVSDNGREFVSVWEDTLTQFGRLLDEAGIAHLTTAPYYPQGNGKAEAFIRTMTREVLTNHTFDSLEALQAALDRWVHYYNNYRAHSQLGWQPPVSRFAGIYPPQVQGLAAIPGLEQVRLEQFPSHADPPPVITPQTAANRYALVPLRCSFC